MENLSLMSSGMINTMFGFKPFSEGAAAASEKPSAQDVVADAMTVEAIPTRGSEGREFPKHVERAMHTTMQTLGRFAIISGLVAVAALNIFMFTGVEAMSEAEKAGIARMIVITKMDDPQADFSSLLEQCREIWGTAVVPIQIPVGQGESLSRFFWID